MDNDEKLFEITFAMMKQQKQKLMFVVELVYVSNWASSGRYG